MKTKEKTWPKHLLYASKRGLLALVMLSVLFMPLMITKADAQRYGHHANTYRGMASVVEKEMRMNEQLAIAENENEELNTDTAITVDADTIENRHLICPVGTLVSEDGKSERKILICQK